MLITVVVESMFVGSASGFTQVVVDDSEPVQAIINKFCDIKGAPVDPDYAIINDANVSFDNQRSISEYRVQDNDHLRLGRRRPPSQMFRYVNWYRLAVVGTAIGLFGLIGSCLLYLLVREVPYKYGVVFDAGSTHTGATVYYWPGGKYRNTGQVKVLEHDCEINSGGIADVPPSNVSGYLEKCLVETKSVIPSHLLYEAEVYFGATAGMRILEERNRTVVNAVLEKVRESLGSSGLVFEDSNADIIPGEREGLTGWISVNFLNNSLRDDSVSCEGKIHNGTIGSLDLGGASVQIAVETESPDNGTESQNFYPLNLFDHNYTVYTESFLCYGLVQAMNRYRALLILDQAKGDNVNISSPCEPSGLSYAKTFDDIFGVPCAPLNKESRQQLSGKTFTFRGTSDTETCGMNVSALLKQESCTRLQSPHCLGDIQLPKEVSSSRFMAYSAFGHAIDGLKLPHRGSQKDFLARLSRVCQSSFDQLAFIQETFTPDTPLSRWQERCFTATYIQRLLSEKFGFTTEEDWTRIDFRNKVNGVGVGWSVGYMVNQTVYSSPSNSIPDVDMTTFVILLCVFSLVLLFGFLFLFHATRLDKLSATSYESMTPPWLIGGGGNLETIKIVSRDYPLHF